jgi:hypothetical protein
MGCGVPILSQAPDLDIVRGLPNDGVLKMNGSSAGARFLNAFESTVQIDQMEMEYGSPTRPSLRIGTHLGVRRRAGVRSRSPRALIRYPFFGFLIVGVTTRSGGAFVRYKGIREEGLCSM